MTRITAMLFYYEVLPSAIKRGIEGFNDCSGQVFGSAILGLAFDGKPDESIKTRYTLLRPIEAQDVTGYNHVRIRNGGEAMKRETITRIRRFTKERDWEQYHTPANLAKSISIEANELLECFQWSDTDYDLAHVGEELADVMVYCQNMLDALGLDADAIINAKMDQNEAKYPVEKCRGSNAKYDQL